MQNKPKVSVIMATHNCEKYLDESIQSILNQTFKDFELIVINDASTDQSANIINRLSSKDKRIRIINNPKKLGPAGSRNKGLRTAKGKYIAILDSDDIALPKRLETQYKYLEKNKSIFLIGSSAIIINNKGNTLWRYPAITGTKQLKDKLKNRNCIIHSSVMFKSRPAYFYRTKFYFAHDYDFYLMLLTEGKNIENLKIQLTKYRYSPESISFKKRLAQALFALKAAKYYKQRLVDKNDEYESLNPKLILNADQKKIKDQKTLEMLIRLALESMSLKEVRRFSVQYIRQYGIINKIGIYWLITYMPKYFLKHLFKVIIKLKRLLRM